MKGIKVILGWVWTVIGIMIATMSLQYFRILPLFVFESWVYVVVPILVLGTGIVLLMSSRGKKEVQ